ncbi:HXXXD-type acyl-transferase family protein [Striga asiatica]|uniref:HXXXD-type acyl-transferase family protein n=1 Tax=Striga asiatica TaxID=4170 RepID=A0A5A7P3G3_STRAF|nr:HXXXD-type acyl-transferase family protein [Striga asiatica]
MALPENVLTFKVTRKKPELLRPAKPTPHEFKSLSDIDDQESLRVQIPVMQFYRKSPSMEGKDPVRIIRTAVSRALVYYYPLAGRLREVTGRKLVVECTGEGVLFIEADADVSLAEFVVSPQPPFHCFEELLYDVPGSSGVTGCPLMLIQFMSAIGEHAIGAQSPSILPVWERQLLTARDPPRVTRAHLEYDTLPDGDSIPLDNLVQRSFFFGPAEISALRSLLQPNLNLRCTTFELVTACLWRCRTAALATDRGQVFRLDCIVNCRKRLDPPLPDGYYGNALVWPAAVSAAGDLSDNPLEYAVGLVRRAKSEATEEYVRSVADRMVKSGRPIFSMVRTLIVSDLTGLGFEKVDYGWGHPIYGGNPVPGIMGFPGVCFYSWWKNSEGEKGVLVPVYLPASAMEVFAKELKVMIMKGNDLEGAGQDTKVYIKSDYQEGLRFHAPIIQFYRKSPSMEGKDPVSVGVIRAAVSRALVYYYPLAGRLREVTGRKLVVECTGEGVLFIEADADVSLAEFGVSPQPPFDCFEELLYDVPGSGGVTGCPLMLIQACTRNSPLFSVFGVTRLKCGGFIFALRFNHTMVDATCLVQFMSAISELALGAQSPSILPVWERHLLSARDPPRVTRVHLEYDPLPDEDTIPLHNLVQRSFFFGSVEISALRRRLSCRCTTFDLMFDPPLPDGYYGNALVWPAAVSAAGDLSDNPLEYAVELVRRAKSEATEEKWITGRAMPFMVVIRYRESPNFSDCAFTPRGRIVRGKGNIDSDNAMEVFVKELKVMVKGNDDDLEGGVTRQDPEFIPPAEPTPHDFKSLSDIDDQPGLRFHVPIIQFYRKNPSMEGKDPVGIIRTAVSRALVYYYPLAGRLREISDRKKLVVECTGEGILFVEADADVALREFGDCPHPPFPCFEELLYDVTRLKCGGFIIGWRVNHVMGDGAGLVQLMSAVGEISRGAHAPSILPVWERHLLDAWGPLKSREYDPDAEGDPIPLDNNPVQRCFFFGSAEISALRRQLPSHYSTFDVVTGCLWRCRTAAISTGPHQVFRVNCIVDCRKRFDPPLPGGYYGNVVVGPPAVSAAGELCGSSLEYAVELVRRAKLEATEEYVRVIATRGRVDDFPRVIRNFVVSDLTSMGIEKVDYGWGEPVYGGNPVPMTVFASAVSSYTVSRNSKGESGILVPMSLPANAMEVFAKEVRVMVKGDNQLPTTIRTERAPTQDNMLYIKSGL